MEELDNISQKNINDKWLDNIFESLMRLESYERLAKEGCDSIMEYVQSLVQGQGVNIDMTQVQKKNYDLFFTEFEILLKNVRHLIDKKTFLRMQIKLNQVIELEQKVNGFLFLRADMIQHKEWYEMKPEFYIAINYLSELRGMIVSSLWKMLSPNSRESFEGLPQ